MVSFDKIVFVNGPCCWYCANDGKMCIDITKMCTYEKGLLSEDLKEEDLPKFFDLTNSDNVISNYMSKNQSEIKKMLAGEHEKYNLHGVSVSADGEINIHFTNGEYFVGDAVPLDMSLFPGLLVETGDENDTKYLFSTAKDDVVDETAIPTTSINIFKNGDIVQTIKFGKYDGKNAVYIRENV